MTPPGRTAPDAAAWRPPATWRAVVRVAGGAHVLGRRALVIHDQGVTYARDSVERWRWWFGPPARMHRGVVLRFVPAGKPRGC